LETEGYATQSFIIPACGVEAPHRRDRIWILGKLMDDSKRNEHIEEIRGGNGEEREDEKRQREEDNTSRISSGASGLRVSDQGHETSRDVADTESDREDGVSRKSKSEHGQGDTRLESSGSNNGRIERGSKQDVADSGSKGSQGHRGEHGLRETSEEKQAVRGGEEQDVSNAGGERGRSGQTDRQDAEDVGELTGSQEHREGNAESGLGGMVDGLSSRLDRHHGFEVEPDIPRVAENIPDRVNRLKALGNSIVPQIIYHIGMAILEEERK